MRVKGSPGVAPAPVETSRVAYTAGVQRLAQLRRNAGTFGVLQTVFVLLFFGVLAGATAASIGAWQPLAALGLGVLVPTLLRRVLVDHAEQTSRFLAGARWGLLGFVVVASVFRDRVEAALGTEGLVASIVLLATAYTAAFFWLWSDPDVRRVP